jgi:hypothetical protein
MLEIEMKNPNIFEILSITKKEIRHSNFLAWLLDSNGTHGLGNLFLQKFLRVIAKSDKLIELDELDIPDINHNDVEIRREWNNIDILIIFDDLVICIENKIDSMDHSNQLRKYRDLVTDRFPNKKRKAFIYLSPTGASPNDSNESKFYSELSYFEIIDFCQGLIKLYGESMNPRVRTYLQDYIQTLNSTLMNESKANKLADKIYKNHKDILEFVFEHRTDIASHLYPAFERKIEESGWIIGSKNKGVARFLTPKLTEIIPHKGTGWPNNENFLFQLDFYWSEGKLKFNTVISPCPEYPELHQILKKAIELTPGHKKPRGKSWLVHFNKSYNFIKDDFFNAEQEDIIMAIDKYWDDITSIVIKVEASLMNYKDEILRFKSSS